MIRLTFRESGRLAEAFDCKNGRVVALLTLTEMASWLKANGLTWVQGSRGIWRAI